MYSSNLSFHIIIAVSVDGGREMLDMNMDEEDRVAANVMDDDDNMLYSIDMDFVDDDGGDSVDGDADQEVEEQDVSINESYDANMDQSYDMTLDD